MMQINPSSQSRRQSQIRTSAMEPISAQFEQVGRMLGGMEAKVEELTQEVSRLKQEVARLKVEVVTKDEIIKRMRAYSELVVKASDPEPVVDASGW